MLSHVRVLIKPLSSKYGVLEYPEKDRKTSRALFCKRNLGANETLEQTNLWKRDSVCLFVVRYAGQQVL